MEFVGRVVRTVPVTSFFLLSFVAYLALALEVLGGVSAALLPFALPAIILWSLSGAVVGTASDVPSLLAALAATGLVDALVGASRWLFESPETRP